MYFTHPARAKARNLPPAPEDNQHEQTSPSVRTQQNWENIGVNEKLKKINSQYQLYYN